MAFTADELQSLNDILEKKLAAHRQEMERVFDLRIQTLRRELERRLSILQQEMLLSMTQKQAEQQKNFQASFGQKLNAQELNITQAVDLELKQRQQLQQSHMESLVDRALAAQLLAIEELLNQRLSAHPYDEEAVPTGEQPRRFEAIEVQTDIPWEDLSDIFGKVLDERFVKLNELTQATMTNWEQYFSAQLRVLQTQKQEGALQGRQIQAYSGNLTSLQEVFLSIEQLERLIESMQVAMTSNHALLSNRLYHHQQLPLERAHTQTRPPSPSTHPNGTNTSSPLSLPEEQPGK